MAVFTEEIDDFFVNNAGDFKSNAFISPISIFKFGLGFVIIGTPKLFSKLSIVTCYSIFCLGFASSSSLSKLLDFEDYYYGHRS